MSFLSLLLFTFLTVSHAADPQYMVGVGKADITGPAADVNMMGFAHPNQRTAGIHMRLYSRAFITCMVNDTDDCNVFVSADIAMGCTAINIAVFDELSADPDLGGLYDEKNVVLSGTHSHSGPGGYLQYLTFTITSLGFVNVSHEAIVTGIVASIRDAHNSMVPGNVYVNTGDLFDSNLNRSPTAYLNNPEEEKEKYLNNTDTRMVVAKFVDESDVGLGLISWFAVHPVSMNNTNHLISGDNKGYASYLAEMEMGGDFVAAFPNSNQGDVSPNLDGPKCMDTGEPCEMETSTCNGRAQMCIASGPGKDIFESTKIVGEKQYAKAKELYNSAADMVTGAIGSIHQFVDMSNYSVIMPDNSVVKTCAPALGYSFAAGCIDGAGFFSFTQGDTEGSPFWDLIRDFLKPPSQELLDCQAPKPVLLPTGEAFQPWQWHPEIVDTQMLQIGNLFITAVPGEFSTMAGRRLRDAIHAVVPNDATVVITGLSNTYTHYITTPEEYDVQRYEGASTIYGRNTMRAYIQQYTMLAEALVLGETDVEPGPSPPDLLDRQNGLLGDTRIDPFIPGGDVSAGDVYIDVDPKYRQGSVVTATFWASNPRHNTMGMLGDTFLEVLRQQRFQWLMEYDDHDWCTRFYWETDQTGADLPRTATVYWEIPIDQAPGMYRLVHSGFRKPATGGLLRYTGWSEPFEVVSADYTRP